MAPVWCGLWAARATGCAAVPALSWPSPLLVYAAAHRWRVALVGASPEVMDLLVARLQAEIPDLDVAAIHGYQDR